ncbi:MAG: UPF0280 family protein [Syntrophales bacterium]
MPFYQRRFYRNEVFSPDLAIFEVKVKETDLFISAGRNLSDIALNSVCKYRNFIEEYIKLRPKFMKSFSPIEKDDLAPPIIRDMLDASSRVNVGPMASVAGAIAQYVAQDILEHTDQVIVENGGDIYLKSKRELRIGVYSGKSPLSGKIKLRIRPEATPLGICTSSGTVGHSVSFGRADAVCVISKSAVLADAAATAVGNRVNKESDIRPALQFGLNIEGVLGILIIIGDKMGASGMIEFI